MPGVGLTDLILIIAVVVAFVLIFGWHRTLASARTGGGRVAIGLVIVSVLLLLAINGFALADQWKWTGRILALGGLIAAGIIGTRATRVAQRDG